MREGPQLGVDAYGVRRCGSVMPVCKQPVATLTLQTFAKVFLGRRLESYYFLHMPEDITSQIKRLAPLLEEDSDVFRELETFFSENAKINMHRDDLSNFLQDNRTYQVIRVSGNSYKDCVYELIDNHPETMDSIGMLRYYKAPAGNIKWEDVEAAEIVMGNELTMNAYGWSPDAWTIFENNSLDEASAPEDKKGDYSLVAIVALDSLL